MFTTRVLRLAWFILCLGLLGACASNSVSDVSALNEADISNLRSPDSRVFSSGQPTMDQLRLMSEAGVRHVVNLRTPQEEVDFNEQAAVEALGMNYYSIPVAGADGINRDNAATLQALLAQTGDEPVLVHCATGNRVGGLMAVQAYESGASLDDAIEEGARWGMTSERLQQSVRDNLSSN